MVQVNIVYNGQLRCTATHEPSGTQVITDAPKDNQGLAQIFSPTDLVATALGSCILSVMGIAARGMQINLEGSKVTVKKEMVSKPIRRIAKLLVVVEIPTKLTDEQKEKLEYIAHTCPVHQSLHPDIEAPIEFRWAS